MTHIVARTKLCNSDLPREHGIDHGQQYSCMAGKLVNNTGEQYRRRLEISRSLTGSYAVANYAAKVSSACISVEVMSGFIAQLPVVLREIYGPCKLTICYGFSCNLHMDLLWKDMSVPLDRFQHFVDESVQQNIYEICASDLHISSPDSKLKIMLCHESDIHLDGTDDDAIAKIASHFPDIDFRSSDKWKKHHGRK